MSDPAAFAFTPGVLLAMALVALALAACCVLLIARDMVASSCDCAPTVLKNQHGGYSSKVYHSQTCRLFKAKKGIAHD